jgi:hypothetical protein
MKHPRKKPRFSFGHWNEEPATKEMLKVLSRTEKQLLILRPKPAEKYHSQQYIAVIHSRRIKLSESEWLKVWSVASNEEFHRRFQKDTYFEATTNELKQFLVEHQLGFFKEGL